MYCVNRRQHSREVLRVFEIPGANLATWNVFTYRFTRRLLRSHILVHVVAVAQPLRLENS